MKAPTRDRVEGLLFDSASTDAGCYAIISANQQVSYGDLADRVAAFAHELLAQSLNSGDRVGIYLDKSVECVVAIFATWLAQGIVVPINEGLRERQVQHILDDADCKFLVTNKRKLRSARNLRIDGIRVLEVYLTDKLQVAWDGFPVGEGGVQPAAILYTSGSSGPPKGILLSHNNLLAGTRIVRQYLGVTRDDRILSVLPFSFDYGLNQLLVSVSCGAVCVLQRGTLPAQICQTLEERAITVLAGVPPFWIQLQQEISPFPQMKFPALRILTNSGGAFPPRLIERYRAQLPGARIFLMYGLSEAFRSTYLDPMEIDNRPDSIGKAIPETRIHLINEHGEVCGIDEVGEIVHEGPTVALGYWRNEIATAKVFRAHPFDPRVRHKVVFSGDLARKDAQGFLSFVARNDQLIKSMGYRISPDDVEDLLQASGLVAEVVVTGVPDEVAGQVVVAHVVPVQLKGFNCEHLLEFCRKEMPGYMVPREIVVHDRFPRTSSGKLDRQAVVA